MAPKKMARCHQKASSSHPARVRLLLGDQQRAAEPEKLLVPEHTLQDPAKSEFQALHIRDQIWDLWRPADQAQDYSAPTAEACLALLDEPVAPDHALACPHVLPRLEAQLADHLEPAAHSQLHHVVRATLLLILVPESANHLQKQ